MIATLPMFLLGGFAMRDVASGLSEGALKL